MRNFKVMYDSTDLRDKRNGMFLVGSFTGPDGWFRKEPHKNAFDYGSPDINTQEEAINFFLNDILYFDFFKSDWGYDSDEEVRYAIRNKIKIIFD